MNVSSVGVVGAGTMGAGIAQLACIGGFRTVLHDPIPDALAAGEEKLRAGLAKGTERGIWTERDAEQGLGRLELAGELEALRDCELVIEAAPETLELKRELFGRLSRVCGPEAILATNTSSLSVTAIGAAAERPERVCGMHFFNPPPLMRLVEVVAGDETSERTVAAAAEVARAMRREPIRAADGIGFVANRVARPFTLEALRLLGDGISTHEQIDRIVRIGGGFRMGPFELMDLVGIDVNFEVAKSFWEQSFHEPRWQPHPIQARMVAARRLGRKTGRGYYDYRDGPHRPEDPPAPRSAEAIEGDPEIERTVHWEAFPSLEDARVVEIAAGPGTPAEALAAAERRFAGMGRHVERVRRDSPGLVLGRIVCQLVNEAHFAVGHGVASAEDVDTAMRLGFNWPRGPFEWTEAIGAERVVSVLDALRSELGEERYRVAPLLRAAARAPTPRSRARSRRGSGAGRQSSPR